MPRIACNDADTRAGLDLKLEQWKDASRQESEIGWLNKEQYSNLFIPNVLNFY